LELEEAALLIKLAPNKGRVNEPKGGKSGEFAGNAVTFYFYHGDTETQGR
jgi:hypothetical protein